MALILMNYDIPELLTAFSELLPLTNEELGQYWFRYNRGDGLSVVLSMSVYDGVVGLIVRLGEVAIASVHLSECLFVRVSSGNEGQVIEVGSSRNNPESRCVLSLDGNWILRFADGPLAQT